MRRRTFSNNKGLPIGTILNFEYTGKVQEVTLPPGKYKLQTWGAQGGNSYSYSGVGSKGGYSEGILTLKKETTLFVFVGGKGGNGSSTSLVNGGWNGGGASVGRSSYDSSGTYGVSYPACGGGATDIALVDSDMVYSSGRTNRSAASLLSRCIVAGGGAGGSARYTSTETTTTKEVSQGGFSSYFSRTYVPSYDYTEFAFSSPSLSSGETYVLRGSGSGVNSIVAFYGSNYSFVNPGSSFIAQSGFTYWSVRFSGNVSSMPSTTFVLYKITTAPSTSSSNSSSNSAQQGGGTSGKGNYPGTQSAAGSGGAFGLGANQTTTNYRYASGAGGGGWYGGGSSYSDSSTSYINYSGGGSGFVNTAANASYRPSGYTGLELDSGSTKDGATSFPAPSGGNETGHSGNGYARIIAVDKDGNYPVVKPAVEIVWSTRSGTWNNSTNSSAADGKQFTCVSPGTNGSTVLRCTFSGVSQIVFRCRYQGESNYDYLTIGNLDTACTRSSYGTTLKGTSGTWRSITFTLGAGEHYVEFCYSKDGSGNTSPDNADVYIESYA